MGVEDGLQSNDDEDQRKHVQHGMKCFDVNFAVIPEYTVDKDG